jgi:uncharacterized protein YjiS (DUF1127 family)
MPATHAPGAAPPRAVPRLIGLVAAWRDRARERHQLARLDDRALRDMGLSRCDVAEEVGKPFWRG